MIWSKLNERKCPQCDFGLFAKNGGGLFCPRDGFSISEDGLRRVLNRTDKRSQFMPTLQLLRH